MPNSPSPWCIVPLGQLSNSLSFSSCSLVLFPLFIRWQIIFFQLLQAAFGTWQWLWSTTILGVAYRLEGGLLLLEHRYCTLCLRSVCSASHLASAGVVRSVKTFCVVLVNPTNTKQLYDIYNVGPTSKTLGRHCINVIQLYTSLRDDIGNTRRWPNGGLMLDHRRRRWPNIKPT